MKAVLLSPRTGEITVVNVPAPVVDPGFVLISNDYSLISAGTERATVSTGAQSLIGKARQRPDQVKQVLDGLRRDGVAETVRVVQDRLSRPMPLGYSCAGTVVAVGEGVELGVGTRVAAAGAGYASHAEVVSVPVNLTVPCPPGLDAKWAAFGTVGAIALQGVHQADLIPGSRIAVIGLGLVGQLTVRLLSAYGYAVCGIDLDPTALALAEKSGVTALPRSDSGLSERVADVLGGRPEAVIITAATSSSDPVELAGELAADRARVVIVGDVLVAPTRGNYYHKELTILYSRSYGPGRYDPEYEERGGGYPDGYVPWTENRNLAEVLRLLHSGAIELESLQPEVFPVAEAAAAYAKLRAPEEGHRRLALLLQYPSRTDVTHPTPSTARRAVEPNSWSPARGQIAVGLAGAGNFATKMLLPPLRRDSGVDFAWIATARGYTAAHQARRWKVKRVVESVEEGLAVPGTDAVVISTRHDSHARLAADALTRGVAVFCEKPIGLTESDLDEVARGHLLSGAPAMVGFNRRFSPAVQEVLKCRGTQLGPAQLSYRVFAGRLPSDHWYFDPRHGGRLLGEVCHFIDTAAYVLAARVAGVRCRVIGPGDGITGQSFSLEMDHVDGSVSTVTYGGFSPAGPPKELIEIAGDGFAARIDDFRSVEAWSRAGNLRKGFKGGPKGHAEELAHFLRVVRGVETDGTGELSSALHSSLVAVRGMDSIATGGQRVVVDTTAESLSRVLRGD